MLTSKIDRSMHRQGPLAVVLGMLGMEVENVFAVLKPMVFWPVIALSSVAVRMFWPDSWYALGFFSIATVVFTWFTWHLTFKKEKLASFHAMFSVVAVGALICAIDVIGWTHFTVFASLFGVGLLCMSWSVRAVVRNHEKMEGHGTAELFNVAGMDGAKMIISKPDTSPGAPSLFKQLKAKVAKLDGTDAPRALEAPATGKQRSDSAKAAREVTIKMNAGDTVEDLTKKIRNVESAAKVPPGTLIVSPDLDNANQAKGVISDPRSIRRLIPYPGPSFVGGSIADTISSGLYQDGIETEWELPGAQVQIMGMTGSGKSLGGAWGTLAEIITRYDAVVWAVDVTKGHQTLGPLETAIHRLETDAAGAMQLLTDAHALIKPRTNYLTNKGLGKWHKGCGLQYLIVWLEEVPAIMDALGPAGTALWIKSVKAARSAGISFVWSLQKSVATQVPTITRSQAAKWCFGVSDHREGLFGLSSAQKAAGCTPELWSNRQPGTCYLDAPGIDESRVSIPLRTWSWGEDDKLIRAHAEQYPASDRPYDNLMVEVLAGVPAVEEPEITPKATAKPVATPITKKLMDPTAARKLIRDWVMAKPSGAIIRSADITEVRDETGYGRQWGYKVMDEIEADGIVTKTKGEFGVIWTVK